MTRPLLFVSLFVNLALLGAVVFTSRETPTAPLAAPTATPAPLAVKTTIAPVAVANRANPSTPGGTTNWGNIGTENIPSLIDRLRAAGFPSSVIRAIVEQRFELRREELTLDGLDVPYWKNPTATPPDPKIAAELAKLAKEREEVLKTLSSTANTTELEEAEMRDRNQSLYGDLPAEKVSQIQEIQRRWSTLHQEVYDAARGRELDVKKIAQLQKEQAAEISRLLTPAQFLDFELRQSTTSANLRRSLVGFNATEEEFRSLFSLQRALETQFPENFGGVAAAGQMAAFTAAQEQMKQQIKGLLPPERYVDYEQASRPGAQQLNTLVERLGLPLSAAAKVSAVQQDVQSRAAQIGRDQQLSADERARQVTALVQAANNQIAAAIGPRGLAGYRQYGGQWLDQLQARANAPAGKQP